MTKKILFLSANPGDTDRLRLDKEVSEIKEGLRRAKYREQFEILSEWAVSFDGLRRALLDHEPQIVHFSGHGDKGGLILEGELGLAVPISSEALSGLFKLCSKHVECIILNACYSALQAAAINKHINYVIGMPGKINDKAAIQFSIGFYDALGAGKSIEEAFQFGCDAILAVSPNLPKHLIPVLKKRGNYYKVPVTEWKKLDENNIKHQDSVGREENKIEAVEEDNNKPGLSQKGKSNAKQIVNIGTVDKLINKFY